ncbi:MAG: hypothetical protein PUB42_07250 [Firmicutes bacterium]|nr:hypothetical protein [Bacillota bacterium]
MIKISRHLYIHVTTALLFVLCFLNRRLEILAVSYAAITAHELAHLAAASFIGLTPSHIIFYPFGVNLKLKNRIVYGLSDEIILYAAGPFSNILMALASIPFINENEYANLFYINNIFLFMFNMLPILPMDGAAILKKLIAHKIGQNRAETVLKFSTIFLIGILLTAEILIFVHGYVNFSILFTVVFLTGNLFTNKEKYHVDFLKELMFFKKKENFKFRKAKPYIIKENESYNDLAKNFAQGSYYIVFVENKSGGISKIVTEKQIIEKILRDV